MRRSKALTDEVRALFEELVARGGGWTPGSTIPDIALATGLSPTQVRDALFGESADAWRADWVRRRQEKRNAVHQR